TKRGRDGDHDVAAERRADLVDRVGVGRVADGDDGNVARVAERERAERVRRVGREQPERLPVDADVLELDEGKALLARERALEVGLVESAAFDEEPPERLPRPFALRERLVDGPLGD